MFSGLTSGAQALGLRFTVSGLLPFAVLAAFGFGIGAMLAAGGSTGPAEAVAAAGQAAGPAGLAVLLVGAFVGAVVTQPFQVAVVRLLEGYWGVSLVAVRARAIGVEVQRRRRHRLTLALRDAELHGEQEDAAYLSARLDRFPPPDQLMPTLLGNALRASERSAGERYGLDTVGAWSRLYYLLPDTFQRDVAELHGQVDGSARLTVALAVAGASSAPVLAVHGWWNLVWVAALALALLAYQGGVTAATALSAVLAAAFDLHRFEMLEALHLPLPQNSVQERIGNAALGAFWAGQADDPLPAGVDYGHS